jgi:acyl-CoA hydrolase
MKAFFISGPPDDFANFAIFRAELRKAPLFQVYTDIAALQILRIVIQVARAAGSAPMHMSCQPIAGSAEPTRFVEMVFPEHANHYGTLFGGHALSLMGKAAFVAATRRVRCSVVMATSDKVEFHEPVRVGELLELTARIERVGRSSMTVAVSVVAERLSTGQRQIAVQGSFEMVAVDEAGRPTPLPKETQETVTP